MSTHSIIEEDYWKVISIEERMNPNRVIIRIN